MPLRLTIQKKLSARSERVKSCDFHPEEPWILSALYSGHVFIWNYSTQSMVKSLEVAELPVRVAKFIPSKNWIVCGCDDFFVHVYNYNTMEEVHKFEAHADYIRSIAVHPSLPLLLTSSDDMMIKLWDWEKGWALQQTFEGHSHYVMQVEFNPKDANTFASASLDRSVRIWGLNSATPFFTLEGHERGVNCVSYYKAGDRPYIISGADDHLVKIWDYQTKSCVQTLEGHTNNVSAVQFHPNLPLIITGSEDGTVRLWHSSTYRLENTLNYGMERVWSVCCLKNTNKVALGYDEGTIMIKMGHEEPVASMESGGKVVWANNQDIVLANVRSAAVADVEDGEKVSLQTKDLGTCEVYPQSIKHSPNGRLVSVCGDGEYIIYTALALKNKKFGSALEFVWAEESGSYATRESTSKITIFKQFQEHNSFKPPFAAEAIFGGTLLAVRSSEFVDFYDWANQRLIRRIDIVPRKIFWSESGELVVLACDASFFVLRYNTDVVEKFFDQGVEIGESGIETAFDLEEEIGEKVRTGIFVGDCFIYTNAAGRLQYYIGGEVMTLAHMNKMQYLLGYRPQDNRVYLMDKQNALYSYELLVSVLVYQTAIVRQDFEAAEEAFAKVPENQHSKLARFLEKQDHKALALQITKDPEHKFELAISCDELQLARDVLLQSESEQKWKQLGDKALNDAFDLKLAEECYTKAGDLGSLLLIYSSLGDAEGIQKLGNMSEDASQNNVAFMCKFLSGDVKGCIDLLCATDRIPEAAFLARTYLPSAMSGVLELWKEDLKTVSERASESLADPTEFPELFPNLDMGIEIEKMMAATRGKLPPASDFLNKEGDNHRDLIEEMSEAGAIDLGSSAPVEDAAYEEEEPAYFEQEEPAGEDEAALDMGLGGGEEDILGGVELEAEPEPEPAADDFGDFGDMDDMGDIGGDEEAAPAPAKAAEAVDLMDFASPKSNHADTAAPAPEPEAAAFTDELADLGDLDFSGMGDMDNVNVPSLDDLNASLADLENMGDDWGDDL